jgi:hypothetical protein
VAAAAEVKASEVYAGAIIYSYSVIYSQKSKLQEYKLFNSFLCKSMCPIFLNSPQQSSRPRSLHRPSYAGDWHLTRLPLVQLITIYRRRNRVRCQLPRPPACARVHRGVWQCACAWNSFRSVVLLVASWKKCLQILHLFESTF